MSFNTQHSDRNRNGLEDRATLPPLRLPSPPEPLDRRDLTAATVAHISTRRRRCHRHCPAVASAALLSLLLPSRRCRRLQTKPTLMPLLSLPPLLPTTSRHRHCHLSSAVVAITFPLLPPSEDRATAVVTASTSPVAIVSLSLLPPFCCRFHHRVDTAATKRSMH